MQRAVSKLFQDTPNDNHPVMVKVLALPIASALCCFTWHFVVESAESALTAALGWQVISDRKLCLRNQNLTRRESEGETTILQNRMHPSQQKKSSIFSVRSYFPQSPSARLPSPSFGVRPFPSDSRSGWMRILLPGSARVHFSFQI